MAILANRVRTQNNIIELSKFIIYSAKKLSTSMLVIASCYLLYFSAPKIITAGLMEVAGKSLSAVSLVYKEAIQNTKFVYNKLLYFKDLESENLKLRLEIASLQRDARLASAAQLENASLKQILNVTKEIKNNFVTAKIVGMSVTPFTSSATVQGGVEDGISINDVVRGERGLVGRVLDVSSNYSTIMLINDHNSRIPVITNNSKFKGILAKQGDDLKMIYLQDDHTATVGEVIYTSGDGKIYPKGVAVATIKQITHEGVFVEMLENLDELDFIIVESKK